MQILTRGEALEAVLSQPPPALAQARISCRQLRWDRNAAGPDGAKGAVRRGVECGRHTP